MCDQDLEFLEAMLSAGYITTRYEKDNKKLKEALQRVIDKVPNFLKVSKSINPTTGKTLECVEKPGAVVVLVTDKNMDEGIFVKQYRVGCKSEIIECPAGVIEESDTPISAAIRELREEIGLQSDDIQELKPLGKYYSSVGWTSEVCHLYLVIVDRYVKLHEQQLDKGESLTYAWVPINGVEKQEIVPAKTALAIKYLQLFKMQKAFNTLTAQPVTQVKKQRICMFGGAFNPLTNMHMAIAQRAIDELNLDKLIFMPVNDHYGEKESILGSAKDRLAMIKGAILESSEADKFEVCDYETSALVQPRTIDSLRYLKAQYPDAEIYFLIGSDNLKTMHTWKDSSKILDEFNLIVTQRNDKNIFQEVVLANNYLSTHADKIHIIPEYITNDISSTAIRNLLKAGRNIDWMVPSFVSKYIREHGLYC